LQQMGKPYPPASPNHYIFGVVANGEILQCRQHLNITVCHKKIVKSCVVFQRYTQTKLYRKVFNAHRSNPCKHLKNVEAKERKCRLDLCHAVGNYLIYNGNTASRRRRPNASATKHHPHLAASPASGPEELPGLHPDPFFHPEPG